MIVSYAYQRKNDEYVTGPSGHNRVVPVMSNRLANGPNIPIANDANGANGANGTNGSNDSNGSNGSNDSNGSNGSNDANVV
jgi:hypothetical protein